MSDDASPPPTHSDEAAETHAALFLDMVAQQANMAFIFLGRAPHPQTGKPLEEPNLEAARLFIEQLEMLAAKTRGNLSPQEAAMMKQTLMATRMAFVQAVEKPEEAEPQEKPQPEPPPAQTATTEAATPPSPADPPAPPPDAEPGPAPAEDRKKFVKKYGKPDA